MSQLSAVHPLSSHSEIPPTDIQTADGVINILQLTDAHLYADTKTTHGGINNYQSFVACLQQALQEDRRCDLILVTGDVVNEVKSEIYDNLYQLLNKTGIPFACIAGNHDVTDKIVTDPANNLHHFAAYKADDRLLSRHSIRLNNWKLLLLDSSVPGKIYGRIGHKNLQWLHKTLANCHEPVIIAMHHHVLPMNSAWINNHITQDADEFWQVVGHYPSVKAVVTGHVHQYYDNQIQGVKVFATPSTCYQFKPNQDEFALDENAYPGYRWLSLISKRNKECIESWVTRLTNKPN